MNHYLDKIGVSWYRKENTLQECTEDFLIFLERLRRFDSNLGVLYKQGKSLQESVMHEVSFEYDYIKKLFCKTCNDQDYPDISFSFSIWNGNISEGEYIRLSTSLGKSQLGVNNSNCMLSMPYKGNLYTHYSNPDDYKQLQELFIDHWKPQYIWKRDQWIEL
ncbi:Imm52 family immunity protein [uncultured Aquimarina sp.]|uniref:Imm52 family immunity protein n=1 Tax=uncultured Aquimarina sp. TaxID=575652 RepID=UPI0026232D21|nr:Imm52 family immunity protein [uncultured Aquimarina sp.]